MTEFYRRYNEVAPFENDFYETSINYKNTSPTQLLEELSRNKNPLLLALVIRHNIFGILESCFQ